MLVYEHIVTDTENVGREGKMYPSTGHEGPERGSRGIVLLFP